MRDLSKESMREEVKRYDKFAKWFGTDVANTIDSYNLLMNVIADKDFFIVVDEIIVDYTTKEYSLINDDREDDFISEITKILDEEGIVENVPKEEITEENGYDVEMEEFRRGEING